MTPVMVIFDCDGVLVDSEPLANAQLFKFLEDRGWALSPEDNMHRFVGRPLADIIIEAREAGATIEKGWRDNFYREMDAALSSGVPLIEGVVDLLDQIEHAGLKTAVVSNGRFAKMKLTLGPHGLWDRLAGKLYSPQKHGRMKPEPDMFLLAAKEAGVAPADCLVIDDSPSGVTGALAAGMRCIGYAQHTPREMLEPLGVTTAASMAEVASLLGLGSD